MTMADRYLVQYAQPIRVDTTRPDPLPLFANAVEEDDEGLDILFEFDLEAPTNGPH
ncbi:hypothetical protein ACG3SL_02160 [Sphingomonas sp. CJ20]